LFQLILNPIRDWNKVLRIYDVPIILFQLILNPIRDWNLNLWKVAKGEF